MKPMSQIEVVASQGISGDAAQGRKNRQILIVSRAVLDAHNLEPGDIRENIVVDGFDVDSLSSPKVIQIGDSRIQISGPCTPCGRLDELRDGLQADLQGSRGVLGMPLNNGIISIGDPVRISDSIGS